MMDEQEYCGFIKEIRIKVIKCEEYRELRHCINDILSEVIDILGCKYSSKNSIVIVKCKKFIDDNYMKEISLETVAHKYYFNPSYFSNLFKNCLGIGFSEYLLQIRLQSAQNLLKQTDDSISGIAVKIGFKDPTYFNRVFKRETGFSPLKYRQINKK